MKNLVKYPKKTIEFFTNALAAKHDEDLKNRLTEVSTIIEECFEKYNSNFDANSLESLVHESRLTHLAQDLLSLYGYDTKAVRNFRLELGALQQRSVRYTCQNCGFETVESMDHVVPKEEFPEFSINPLNLLPSCSKCNAHKSSVWRRNGSRLFLNLYSDPLPAEQYLFVNIIADNGEIDFEFYLDNGANKINTEIYVLIQSHFERLHLCERLRMKSISHLTELENSINERLGNLDLKTILLEVTQTAERNKASYGHNYYKSIMEIALANSKIFHNLFTPH